VNFKQIISLRFWLKEEKMKDSSVPLFDKDGRCIPNDLQAEVCDFNENLYLESPYLDSVEDYEYRLERLQQYLGVSTGISAEEFKISSEGLLAQLNKNPQIANIVTDDCLPIILPQLITADFGIILEQYLEALAKSYNAFMIHLEKTFQNDSKGELINKVSLIKGSRHNQLIKRMKKKSFVGLIFPTAMTGFSVDAQREQISLLPDSFILSGIDIIIAMIMYPDVLARDFDVPDLDLAAITCNDSDTFSMGVDESLEFHKVGSSDQAFEQCSGGLLYTG
jgi:hypothetical protein